MVWGRIKPEEESDVPSMHQAEPGNKEKGVKEELKQKEFISEPGSLIFS